MLIDTLLFIVCNILWFYSGWTWNSIRERRKVYKVFREIEKDMEDFEKSVPNEKDFDKLSSKEQEEKYDRIMQFKGALEMFNKLLGLKKK